MKLKALHRFESAAVAVDEISAMQEGKLGKGLKKFLSEEIVDKRKKESLVVVDSKLGVSVVSRIPSHAIEVHKLSLVYQQKARHQGSSRFIIRGSLPRNPKPTCFASRRLGPERPRPDESRLESFAITVSHLQSVLSSGMV